MICGLFSAIYHISFHSSVHVPILSPLKTLVFSGIFWEYKMETLDKDQLRLPSDVKKWDNFSYNRRTI